MALFELNSALSCELAAAHQLADVLSNTPGVQDLAETNDDAEALEKIKVGISDDPFEGDSFSIQELEDRHLLINIYAEPENGFLSGLSPEAVGVPREGGVFCVAIKRQVRQSEDPSDAYNFFWDRVSSLGSAVITATDIATTTSYRFKQCNRVYGPEFGKRRATADQGEHLEALLTFAWGDIEQE